ncbi:MAG: type I phosphomannose isomerase catalytic subunit [Mycoplasmoidaceae bacterium]
MNFNIILLGPYFDKKIWGGSKLASFGYKLTEDKIGEALIVSTIPGKSSKILNHGFNDIDLIQFYENNQDFFGNYNKKYPILTKIIDANDDLSIQVHPDDEYARIKHKQSGKTECWYILDAPQDAKIVYGIKSKDYAETADLIKNKKWDQLLNHKKVKPGDIIYVPAGMVHAITKGILLYELQQSSDITYRLYDYDRKDSNGQLRPLHINDALNAIKYDNETVRLSESFLIDCKYFKLKKIDIDGEYKLHIPEAKWLEVTIISGNVEIEEFNLKKSDVFLVRNNYSLKMVGNFSILISYIVN